MPVPVPSRELPERYEVERHLADGGMASVWEACDQILGRRVALKLLAHPYTDEPAARARFEREARAAARVSSHPNVVTVYDAGTVGETAYLVMALYPGGTVRDRLKAGGVDRATALGWLADAAAGLDAAHRAGVVHRDVKPGNLLLDERDRVAVGDFGIATAAWAASVTQTGLVVGTMAYLSPEQRAGQRATAASDIWALTMVAHQLLTGLPTDAPLGQGLPDGARAVLEQGLDPDPARRPATCTTLVDGLRDALGAAQDERTRTTQVVAAVEPGATQPLAPLDEEEPTTLAPEPPTPAPARALAPEPPTPAPARALAPEPRPAPPATHRRRRPLGAGLAVLALLAAGGAVAAIAAGGGGGGNGGSTADRAATSTARRTTSTPSRAKKSTSTPAPAPTSTPAAATPAPAASAPAPAAPTGSTPASPAAATGSSGSTPASPAGASGSAPASSTGSSGSAPAASSGSTGASSASGVALDARAKRLTDAGDPAGAVPFARQAVAKLSAQPSGLPYAYALFNLAHALRLSGHPQEALVYLRRRQRVAPGDQPRTVDAEIAAAQRAIKAGAAG